MQPAGDLERLALRPRRRRVCAEVARGGEEGERGVRRPGQERALAGGRLDALDRVEVPVLPDERGPERADEVALLAAGREEGRGQPSSLADLLLAVEEGRKLGKQLARLGLRPAVREA